MACQGYSAALPDAARFCPNCGTPAGTTPSGGRTPLFTMDDFKALEKTGEGPSELRCPRCRIELTESRYRDLGVDECFACGGTWFDLGEMQEFVRRFRERKEAAEGPAIDSKLKRFQLRGDVHYLLCPRCSDRMNRSNFGRISGVIVDRCAEHGIWLDGGEVEKIVEFIRTGGLVEGEKRKLAELETEARAAEARASAARRLRHGMWIGPAMFWDVW